MKQIGADVSKTMSEHSLVWNNIWFFSLLHFFASEKADFKKKKIHIAIILMTDNVSHSGEKDELLTRHNWYQLMNVLKFECIIRWSNPSKTYILCWPWGVSILFYIPCEFKTFWSIFSLHLKASQRRCLLMMAVQEGVQFYPAPPEESSQHQL